MGRCVIYSIFILDKYGVICYNIKWYIVFNGNIVHFIVQNSI